jgi:hypothetical protein
MYHAFDQLSGNFLAQELGLPPASRRNALDDYDEYFDEYFDEYSDDVDAWDEAVDAAIGQGLRNLWTRLRQVIRPTSPPPQLPPARRRIGFRGSQDPEFITNSPLPPPGMRRRIGFRRPGDPDYVPDPFDSFDSLDAAFDWVEEEGAIDAAVPAIANLTLRNTIPGSSHLPPQLYRQLIRSIAGATQRLARQRGTRSVRAMPRIVQGIQRTAQQRQFPIQALPEVIQTVAARVAEQPDLIRQLSQPSEEVDSYTSGNTACVARCEQIFQQCLDSHPWWKWWDYNYAQRCLAQRSYCLSQCARR